MNWTEGGKRDIKSIDGGGQPGTCAGACDCVFGWYEAGKKGSH